jgi:hypothetical protein
VSVSGGRFKVRHRGRAGARGAKVRLRIEGRFDSALAAHGTVGGRVELRRRRGHGRGRVVCRLLKLSWTASLAAPADGTEPSADDEEEVGDDGEDGSDEDDDGSFDDEDEEPDSDESEDYWEDVDEDW